MNRLKKFDTSFAIPAGFAVHPKLFVFFDKKTGTRRFEVKAGKDGSMPVDQAVSLLAVHCVARQQMPKDFSVMVAAGEDLVDNLVGRATKLIRTCANAKSLIPLSRRQQEVLRGVSQNLSNKEIASRLNVSERTIKFHVSALLEKFDVRSRVDLMLEAGSALSQQAIHKRNGTSQRRSAHPETLAFAAAQGVSAPGLVMSFDRRSTR